jgi:16S rRNA processing protein RimM
MPDNNTLITIGVVTSAHGVHGAVKVKVLTDNPRRFPSLKGKSVQVLSRAGQKAFRVAGVKPLQGMYSVEFVEVTDRNTAEALRGAELALYRSELESQPEGSFYVFDLLGLDVLTDDGHRLGQLTDVLSPGANDVFVVEAEGQEVLLPATKEVVKLVDLENRRVIVHLLPGLLGDDDAED